MGFLRLERVWKPGETTQIDFAFPLKAHFHTDRDGKRWVAKSDWAAADQDVIWQMIRTESGEFKKSGK